MRRNLTLLIEEKPMTSVMSGGHKWRMLDFVMSGWPFFSVIPITFRC